MDLTHSRLPPPWGADDLQAGQYIGSRVESPEPRGEEIDAPPRMKGSGTSYRFAGPLACESELAEICARLHPPDYLPLNSQLSTLSPAPCDCQDLLSECFIGRDHIA